MAANGSGNPQQTGNYEEHLANLLQPLGPFQSVGTTMGAAPASALAVQPYANNYGTGNSTAMTTTSSGVQAPNPFGLTTEQIYWALAGTPDSIKRLAESLDAYDNSSDPAKKQTFRQIVNYYSSGGAAFDTGYTPEDAFRAAKSYSQGMGDTTFNSQNWQAGMPVYASMADAQAGGMVGPGATATGNGTNIAGYATGQGTQISPTRTTGGGGGGGTPTTPTAPGSGTTPGAGNPGGSEGTIGGGSTQYGNAGDTGNFPMASAQPWERPKYGEYLTPTRSADIGKPFDFFNDEGYQFRLKEGIDGIQNSAAARGGLNSGNTLKELSKYASGLASQEYGDAYNRFSGNRNFLEGQYVGDRNFGRDVYTGDRNFDYSTNVDERNYNNSNRQWDTTFNNANRIDARNFDYGVYTGDRDFNEGTRRWDLGFNYNAATGDRDFNASNERFLATLGSNANNNYAGAMTQLATLLSQLEMKGAGAGATGDIGAGNTLAQTIQQILATLGKYQTANGTTP